MKIAVLGVAHTQFGELWNKSLTDLLAESQIAAIDDAGIEVRDIDAIFTGNMCASLFSNQSNVGALAAQVLGLTVPSVVIEGACASGGLAVRAGIAAIESGQAKIVLVNGVEKMTDVNALQVTKGLLSAASADWEQVHGVTFPALNALITRLYMQTYGLTREQLALVSVQNHSFGALNPKAHLQKKITVEEVGAAPMIADPLTLLDCSPISDGAASIILCSEEEAKKNMGRCVFFVGSGSATDTITLSGRDDLLTWQATVQAGQQAYEMAGVRPQDIDVVEVHDGFSITQILAVEDLGFCEKGRGGVFFELGQNKENATVVNPSGGLKARGHPVGATGVAQVVEVVLQLRGECGKRQVNDAKIGMIHNVGGCGSNVVVHILRVVENHSEWRI